jgi:hypothetical protein
VEGELMANFMEDKLRYFGTASFEILPHLKEDHFAYWAGESSPRESLDNVEEYRPENCRKPMSQFFPCPSSDAAN